MGNRKKKRSEDKKDTACAIEPTEDGNRNNKEYETKTKEVAQNIEVQVIETINIYERISCENVQVGNNNTMMIGSGQSGFVADDNGRDLEVSDKKHVRRHSLTTSDQSFPPKRRTYAEVCSTDTRKIQVEHKITINKENEEKESAYSFEPKPKQIRQFLETVDDFKKKHFVLLIGKNEHVNNLSALSYVPWLMVMDFDPESRSSGTLSYTEMKIGKRRSLKIGSVQEIFSVAEERTNWVFMTGCCDRPDTLTKDNFKAWKNEVKSSYKSNLQQLQRFGPASTEYTLIVMWPRYSEKSRHIQYAIEKFGKVLSPSIILIDGNKIKDQREKSVLVNLQDDNPSMHRFELDLQDICNILESQYGEETDISPESYRLPGQTEDIITAEKAQWLSEDLDVLYLDDHTGQNHDQDTLRQQEENFFKGGTLPWSWWYMVDSGHLDVERDQMKIILNHIRNKHLKLVKSGLVTLYHAPGTGGTTLGQRILWEMRKEMPSAQVKLRSWVSVLELLEKIEFLCKRTRTLLLLIDGEEQQRVDSIQHGLNESCVVILYVRRRPHNIKKTKEELGTFWLQSNVSKKEATILSLKYKKQCNTPEASQAITKLVREVETGSSHSFIDFGLTVYDYKYKGLESYVKGHLQFDTNPERRLETWHTALVYLSLVYYYGQASLPCSILAKVLQNSNMFSIDELPLIMSGLVVNDFNNGKKQMVRIGHYLIAKEILDQVLPTVVEVNRPLSPVISDKTKKILGKFAKEFITVSGEVNNGCPSTIISKIMRQTFISRKNKAVGEKEMQNFKTKQTKVSQILEDADSFPPYTERFVIMQQLTTSFPNEPQFLAHLGRLYTICRPEEEQNAESCFKKALDMCLAEVHEIPVEDMPFTKKLELRVIYHMYGRMFIIRLSKFTGRYLGDVPSVATDKSNFFETGMNLLSGVQEACNLFYKCREATPQGNEESFGYIGEMQIRLMFCDFVKRHCGCETLHHYMETENDIAAFVKESCVELDQLFNEWMNVEPTKRDNDLLHYQEWYAALFKPQRPTFSGNDLFSRRMEIAKIKMKYSTETKLGVIELVKSPEEIGFIVNAYEQNFEQYDRLNSQQQRKGTTEKMSRKAIDMDYREWLLAIRHHLCSRDYEINEVLRYVQFWFNTFQTHYARFYLFVLKSLIGFGSYDCPGNTQLLHEAQHLKDEVLKHSKFIAKPRFPREWLGPAKSTIRRLAHGKLFSEQSDVRSINAVEVASLEIRKGTICPPNNKATSGLISLDLGSANKIFVKVFFVPASAKMEGSCYRGTRVEFVIGFSLAHGYEAFQIRQLKCFPCKQCGRTIEFRSCDKNIKCRGCLTENAEGDHLKLPKS